MAALPVAPFGRTGHDSTRVIFGAAALGGMSQERADATLAMVDAAGINHIDTAAGYGAVRGSPEAVPRRPPRRVLPRDQDRRAHGDGARAELERSLERMGVDHVDLIQLHNLVEPDEWDVAHGPGGAVEALAQARDEGLVRFIGVTGHGVRIPGMHLRSLERFDFDSVLFPYNHVAAGSGPTTAPTSRRCSSVCAERAVAAQTIKAIARRRWPTTPTGRTSAGTSR